MIDDYREVIEIADEIIEMIEEDLPESVYAKAGEFFDSVLEKTKSIKETIVGTEDVTSGQAEALENMKRGVRKWLR